MPVKITAKRTVKKPVKNARVKVPMVMQLEALECGAACLTMLLAYYEKWVPLEKVRIDCGVSRDGSNAKNILSAARGYGLIASGYRFEPEALKKEGEFPCIIHWNFNHFVVCDGFKGDKVYLNDPARGTITVSMEEFDKSFTGICLMFEPGESFEADGKQKSIVAFAKKRLRGQKQAVIFVMLTMAITNLLKLISPALNRVFMDRLLTGRSPGWARPFFIFLFCFCLIQLIVEWIRAVYSLKINGKIAVYGSTSYMWKVLSLPMEFFSQRMAGDIQQRQDLNETIARSLVETLSPLALNSAMLIFYLIVMMRHSIMLSLLGLAAVLINLLMAQLISRLRMNITRIEMRDRGKLVGQTVSGIEMIETIKSSGAENGFFRKWAGYQASVNTQKMRFERLNQILGLAPAAISSLTGIVILALGVYLVLNGEFTVGMVFAFQGFLNSFMEPAATLITAGQTMQEMCIEMERVEDVMEYPSEAYSTESTEATEAIIRESGERAGTYSSGNGAYNGGYSKLSGNIELKNVTFGYSKLSSPLINNFNLSLKAGQRVAFVGTSGCGKSTLAHLISGLYKPWSGEILFDGKPIDVIDRNVFTGSLAVVDQDIIIFEDTIANNIKMWDNSIEDFEMIMAARDARIHEDIMQREGGYNYVLTEGGKDFSGGQRQRLEIARVLAEDPTIIILDEATSALDARTEFEVVKAIKDRGITCIVVAHRLSTIRDCDEIVVMHEGNVIERGTHDELYSKGGYYTKLVVSD